MLYGQHFGLSKAKPVDSNKLEIFQLKVDHVLPFELDPKKIIVEQVPTNIIQEIQPKMSKAVWRPAPGRKLGFLVKHETDLLGVAFLASPVINMGDRDASLGLPKDPSERGKELRHYADLSACVATQPFGWHWNGGKLVALIATTLGDFWQERYDDELKGIITTSLWGKGSQYNRVYKMLGYTKGYGHEHISNEVYLEMLKWMKDNNVEIPSSKFGAGSNPRMRRIAAYKKATGNKELNFVHGKKRGIYYHEAVEPDKRQEMIDFWYERWGKPRFDRTKDQEAPYNSGIEGESK